MLAYIFLVFDEKENGRKLADDLNKLKEKLTEEAKAAQADIEKLKVLAKYNENNNKLGIAIQITNEINKLIDEHIEGSNASFKAAKDVESVKKLNEKGKEGADKVHSFLQKKLSDPYEIVFTLFEEEKYGKLKEGKQALQERLERKKTAIAELPK